MYAMLLFELFFLESIRSISDFLYLNSDLCCTFYFLCLMWYFGALIVGFLGTLFGLKSVFFWGHHFLYFCKDFCCGILWCLGDFVAQIFVALFCIFILHELPLSMCAFLGF
ncbi:hypothetical protein AMTRI_Chr02g266270 [Amborella trichopoda]